MGFECPLDNGTFPDPDNCEGFFLCENGVFERTLCPDGLYFDLKLAPYRYACSYPIVVDCGDRPIINKDVEAKSSGPCKRQWGMFFSGDASNCGDYVNCVEGVVHRLTCPHSLAWDPKLWVCNWPDLVETCDAEAFLGFSCPDASAGQLHPHPKDLRKYFYCSEKNQPRLLKCGSKHTFDPDTKRCQLVDNEEDYY